MKDILWVENKTISGVRWIPPKLLWPSLAVLILACGVAQAKSISKRMALQEIRFEEILEAEQRLADLGYWTGPIDGNLDVGSRHALVAFQKVEGRQRTGRLTANELQALRTATRPLPRHMGFAHVEI